MSSQTIKQILSASLSKSIPRKALNVLYMLFSGIEASFNHLEHKILIYTRERNILRATSIQSLRTHAAANGFEPKLREPARGVVQLQINTGLFGRCGSPLYLLPYSEIIDKVTKIKYYYDSDKPLRITTNMNHIVVVDGEIKTVTHVSSGNAIERIYLKDDTIANNSIIISVAGVEYKSVKSFLGNNGINADRQFVVKFSSNMQTPIVLYVKNTKPNDIVQISYRLCRGTEANLTLKHVFETNGLVDNFGNSIDPSEAEMLITNFGEFNFGSDGTDENALRAAIGYNHGSDLLYDNISYGNFLSKYSTLVVQKIIPSENNKSINNIWLQRKQSISRNISSDAEYIKQYDNVVNRKKYILSQSELSAITQLITKSEYALSSHNIFPPITECFSFQIKFDSTDDMNKHKSAIELLIYKEFGTFLHKRQYTSYIDTLLQQYMFNNRVKFEFDIFSQSTNGIYTGTTIDSINYLPILSHDIKILDSLGNIFQLFSNINFITK